MQAHEAVEADDGIGDGVAVGRCIAQVQHLRLGRAQDGIAQALGLLLLQELLGTLNLLVQPGTQLAHHLLVPYERPIRIRVIAGCQVPQIAQRRGDHPAAGYCRYPGHRVEPAAHEGAVRLLGVQGHLVLLLIDQ